MRLIAAGLNYGTDYSDHTTDYSVSVWDAYSGTRTKFFSRALLRFADRYHGRVVHTETVPTKTKEGRTVQKPVIVIYEVRP